MTADARSPRTAAGRALLEAHRLRISGSGANRVGLLAASVTVEEILAIEQEGAILRPRWHHDRSLSPEDRQYCEDCDDLIRRAEAAEAAARDEAPASLREAHPRTYSPTRRLYLLILSIGGFTVGLLIGPVLR